MAKQLFIGLTTEGTTDMRFLESIVKRTFESIALNECQQDIEIFLFPVHTSKTGLPFTEYVLQASADGVKTYGIMTLAIHTDADKDSYEERKIHKILPAQKLLEQRDDSFCKLLTPVIPVRMMEAWMLADKQLLKEEIGTHKSDEELGIDRNPEAMADPKQIITKAIQIATEHLPKRRQHLEIADLYSIIGSKISLNMLKRLRSYRMFQDEVRETYKALNYMH